MEDICKDIIVPWFLTMMEVDCCFVKGQRSLIWGYTILLEVRLRKDENGYDAAYRELKEETGIDSAHIQLNHMMDFTYYNQDCFVEVYVGYLSAEITTLYEEAHPLVWLDSKEDFFDTDRFAGEGNIGHMVEQVSKYGLGKPENRERQLVRKGIDETALCIGVAGSRGG